MQLQGAIMEKIKIADKTSRSVFQNAMRDASTLVMETSIRSTPAATGTLRKSIRREISGSGLQAAIFPVVDYGVFLHGPFESEGGRSRPFTIPAREAQEGGTLYRWAKKKGANPWAVRAAIKKRGIKFNPYLKKAADESENGVQAIFEQSISTLADKLAD